MDLFDHAMEERLKTEAPLAARMRPRSLEEILGQDHIVGPGRLLRRAWQALRDRGPDDPLAVGYRELDAGGPGKLLPYVLRA